MSEENTEPDIFDSIQSINHIAFDLLTLARACRRVGLKDIAEELDEHRTILEKEVQNIRRCTVMATNRQVRESEERAGLMLQSVIAGVEIAKDAK